MTMLSRLAAAAVIGVIVGGGAIYLIQRGQPAAPAVGTQSPAPGSQLQTIHLTEHPTSGAGVQVGSLTGCNASACLGDYLVGLDPVVDVATGKEVGTVAYECFLLNPSSHVFHCPGVTIDLTGRGQIAFTEWFYPGSTQTWVAPITGGTGEFLGVTGSIAVQSLPGPVGDYVITFTK